MKCAVNLIARAVAVYLLIVAFLAPRLNAAAPPANTSPRPASGGIDFQRDIQPIFIKRCYECHGPDKQRSELRLDQKQSALRGGKSGQPVWVPGRSAESAIMARVTSQDSDEMMPPKGDRLTPEQIGLLKTWIDRGADWPDEKTHWAYRKPVRPTPPTVKSKKWPRNDFDRFILAKLEKEGLSPSPEADRATLIRRLSLDLTGLPPSPAEVDAFLKDRRPDAYEKVVDRLLASPHYGEHIGRWWLDLARYADSNGYQVDNTRSIWPYRQWVIDAFNRNLPFGQFTLEQLAGDLLPNATLEQKIATGFNRNSKLNDEGGGDEEEYRVKAVKDRVATVATVWLGSTLACAECHSHKYDPFTQEDYYRFYAIFNNTADRGNYSLEPTIAVPPPSLEKRLQEIRSRLARLQRESAAAERNLPAEQEAWETRVTGRTNIWTVLDLTNAVSLGGAILTNLPDQSVLARGPNPIYDTYSVEARTRLQGITAILLETLTDSSLPQNGPGRWDQTGNFILDEFVATAESAAIAPTAASVDFKSAAADWEQDGYPAAHSIDRNPKTGWAIVPKFGQPNFLILETKHPVGSADETKFTFKLEQNHGNSHTIGRFRISVTTEKDPDLWWPVAPHMAALLNRPLNRNANPSPVLQTPASLGYVFTGVRPSSGAETLGLAGVFDGTDVLEHADAAAAEDGRTPLNRYPIGGVRGGSETPDANRVRENLSPDRRTAEQRAQLASYFRSIAPSIRMIERQIVRLNQKEIELASARYTTPVMQERPQPRPSFVQVRGNFLEKGKEVAPGVPAFLPPLPPNQPANRLALARWLIDPENPLPARVTVNRLWERFFGTALAKTSEDLGRQGEAPSHPELLDWLAAEFLRLNGDFKALQKLLVMSATYRQSAAVHDRLLEKDPANRWLARGPRFRMDAETIRDQALAVSGLLNTEIGGPSVYPVQPFMQGGSDPARQIDFAFRLCLTRTPTRLERQRLLKFYQQQLQAFALDAQAAAALIRQGSVELPARLDARQLAAWLMVANVLLNLDETLTKG